MPRPPPSDSVRRCLLLLALSAAGGCGDGDRHLFTDTVDCTNLPPLPSDPADPSSGSEALLSELGAGAARVVLRWEDTDGEYWLLPDAAIGRLLMAPTSAWAIKVPLPCIPDSAIHVHFASAAVPLTLGSFALESFGFDAPELEQLGNEPDTEFDGTMTITSESNGRVSGFMTGHARTRLKSLITEKTLGIEVEVTALAFREIALE